jgi:tetratricopeptide (TPR) repeat protein
MDRGNEFRRTGDFVDAALAHRDAVRDAEQSEIPLRLVGALNLLGVDYDDLGRFRDAEQQFLRALAIVDEKASRRSVARAQILVNLSGVYLRQQRQPEAEAILREAIGLYAKLIPGNTMLTALAQSCLAEALVQRGEFREAEPLIVHALAVFEHDPDPGHGYLGMAFNNLGTIRRYQKRDREAALLFERSIALLEKEVGAENPILIYPVNNLASEYLSVGRAEDAEAACRRALALAETHLGTAHPLYAAVMRTYAACLRKTGRKAEAKSLEARAKAVLRDSALSNGTGMTIATSAFRK